ncbi:polyribonucleotide nucleotidyltransferase [Candidatus Microgenomates bacterium]|nr:polyribonucleotide nucleotidyltransferase [Candidatus Microgenomates bacterium]
MKKIEKTLKFGGRTLTLSTGELAGQASGAVLAQLGDTVVLATIVGAPLKMDLGYFPLSVEYQERLYAGGRIKGSRWVKRAGRPTDDETLTARLIDRTIRPLFSESYKKEVQVVVVAYSVDLENDPKTLGAIAASAALAISEIPSAGPVGVVQVGYVGGKYVTNPIASDMETSDLDLVVSSTKQSVVMIEAGAKEVAEDIVLGGIEYAKAESDDLLKLITELAAEVGVKKEVLVEDKIDAKLKTDIAKELKPHIEGLVKASASHSGDGGAAIKDALVEKFEDQDAKVILGIFDQIFAEKMRETILAGSRADGRKHTEVRPLSSRIGVLPRTHGSAIFNRGETQALTVATLGSPSMAQLIESSEGEETKRYIHHYSFPPYCVGEVGRMFGPKRREIGHGALAEKALMPVIPETSVFPYTIQVVSEIMSSNGSSSMASTCGSTLALMDAGVPLTSPVSGIAMGLVIKNDKEYAVLSDIMGVEDHYGDMDLKVTGTEKGITALQLDVKTLNLTPKLLKVAIEQAKEGRAHILASMLKTIKEPNKNISEFAPKIKSIQIPTEKIGELIGPGGKNIKKIMADTGTQVDVEDDGVVSITGVDEAKVDEAYAAVEAVTKEAEVGQIYDGEVVRIQPFGAFVNILPGKDGLVHVSDMAEGFVDDPNTIVKIGDKVKVRVLKVDDMGKIGLSLRMDPSKDKKPEDRRSGGGRGGSRGGDSRGGGRNYQSRGRQPFSRSGSDRGGSRGGDRSTSGRSSGPHFPTSRYMSDSGSPNNSSR